MVSKLAQLGQTVSVSQSIAISINSSGGVVVVQSSIASCGVRLVSMRARRF